MDFCVAFDYYCIKNILIPNFSNNILRHNYLDYIHKIVYFYIRHFFSLILIKYNYSFDLKLILILYSCLI